LPKSTDVTGLLMAWDDWRDIESRQWGLAFVDCAPGEARVPLIGRLKRFAKVVVAHDTDADDPPGGGNYRWRDLAGLFKYTETMRRFVPATTIYTDQLDDLVGVEEVDR
jgi:hypothetical protein